MSFNGSGVFNINTAGQPVVSGTVITATAFNALTADLATGLSTCLTKDGQTNPTANLPMANYKFTGMGAGSNASDSANLGQVQSTVVKLIGSVSGADTITGSLTPALTAYAAGQMFYFVAAGNNTGAVTININSLGAKSITRDGTTALAAGDIQSGEVCVIVYDGTQFQLVNGASQSASIVTENLTVNKATVLNESGGDNDTRIEGDTDANLFFVDASADAIGIGTSSPGAKLDVNGAIRGSSTFALPNVGINANPTVSTGTNAQNLRFLTTGADFYIGTEGSTGGGFYPGSTAYAGVLYNANATPIQFWTSGALRATLDSSGNLGIGTASPLSKLDVRDGYFTGGTTSATNGSKLLANYYSNGAIGTWGTDYGSGGPAMGYGVWPSTTASGAFVSSSAIALFRGAYLIEGSIHRWFSGASQTVAVGSAVSMTQAMTLTDNGNLLLGRTTEPSTAGGRLALEGSGDTALQINKSGVVAARVMAVNTALAFGVDSADGATERARITAEGNVKIGGTADRGTTEGTAQLVLFDGTAPVGTLTNGVSFYSASGEARVMDAAGNSTLLSPHDVKTNEWIFHSKHTPTGKVLRIDVERLLKFVNDHFGLDAVQEFIEP